MSDTEIELIAYGFKLGLTREDFQIVLSFYNKNEREFMDSYTWDDTEFIYYYLMRGTKIK